MPTVAFIHSYFNAEKKESLLFIIIGVLAIAAAVLLYFLGKTPFCKGMAIPFIVVGLLHAFVGYNVYNKSNGQRIDIAYQYGISGNKAPVEEIERMKTVMKNFVIYRYTEMVLALVGIVLVLLFKNNIDKQFWLGFGIALAFMAIVSLSADFFAEKRGNIYSKLLQQSLTNNSPTINPNTKP